MSNLWNRLSLSAELQANLPELQSSRVLLIGAGGLGNDIAIRMAGCHIAHLTIVDGDTVSDSNLPHSTLFLPNHIGAYKVDVIQQYLTAKYADLAVEVRPVFVQQLDPAIIAQHDLVIVAPDNDQTRRWVNYYAVEANVPTLYLGVSGMKSAEWTGYTYLYKPKESGCFACFANAGKNAHDTDFNQVSDTADIEEARNICGGKNVPMPMLSPVVGAIAGYASTMALMQLARVGKRPTYSYIDLNNGRIMTMPIQAVPDCFVCGKAEEFEMSADFLAKLQAMQQQGTEDTE